MGRYKLHTRVAYTTTEIYTRKIVGSGQMCIRDSSSSIHRNASNTLLSMGPTGSKVCYKVSMSNMQSVSVRQQQLASVQL